METTANQGRATSMKFHGKTGEYFGIWIVNILFTILTLGIYSAWATVRNKRYFYQNTEIDGHRFKYLAEPMQILKGRIIAIVVFALYSLMLQFSPVLGALAAFTLMIFTPYIVVSGMRFNARMTSYRNIRFNFVGKVGEAAKVFIGWPLLATITLFILYPVALRKIDEFLYNNLSYGDKKFSSELSSGTYYKAAIGAFVIIVGLMFVVVAMTAGMGGDIRSGASGAGFVFIVMYVLALSIAAAFYKALIRNHIYQNTQVAEIATLGSDVSVGGLTWLHLSNALAIMFSLGLALPWVKIRTANFYAEHTQVAITPEIDKVLEPMMQEASAIGEEVSQVFDVDVALS